MSTEADNTCFPEVRNRKDIRRHDGLNVHIYGKYQAIVMPSKRPAPGEVKKEYAMIVLCDGTEVLIGTYNTPEALRDPAELARFDNLQVSVSAEVHWVMPGTGQAPRKPGICKIIEIREV